MVYRTFDQSIQVPVNVRLKDMFVFEVMNRQGIIEWKTNKEKKQHPNPILKTNLRNVKAYWGYKSHADGMVKPSIRLLLKDAKVKKKKKTIPKEDFSVRYAKDLDLFETFDSTKDMPYSKQLQMLLEDRQMQHLLVCTVDGKTNFFLN